MSIPGRYRYRAVVVVVALAFLLGLSDKAFSHRLASFTADVVSDVIAEVAELVAPPARRLQTVTASGPVWDGPRFEFPSAAEFPAAFSAFGFEGQPWTALGTPLVIGLEAIPARGGQDPTSTASFSSPRTGQRRTATRGALGAGGAFGAGGAAEAAGAAGAATPSADPAAIQAAVSLETPHSGLWSELGSSGTYGGQGGSSEELAANPNQNGGGDIGAFGDTQYGLVPPIGPIATGLPSEAPWLDSAIGVQGLDLPDGLDLFAVPDGLEPFAVPDVGAAPSDLDLEWPGQLRSQSLLDLSPSALTGKSASRANAVIIVSEPTMLAVFGIGLLALASRLRSKLGRARS